jgi:hypothetical protein
MRFAIVSTAAALLCLAAGCRDDNRQSSLPVTAPPQPALTMRTLPINASTICVANVRQRDQLSAKPQTAATSRTIIALGAVIDDVCN